MKLTNIFSRNGENDIHAIGDSNTQFSLQNGDDIFNQIRSRIQEAQSSIWIAAAWFTDQDLFDELLKRYELSPEIEVRIILDGNKDNFFLPFKHIVDRGGDVRLIKKDSLYGRMHDKFCLFDSRILINGSYNWSKNARSNNEENVIVTMDPVLVEEYEVKFKTLYEKSVNFDPDNLNKIDNELNQVELANEIKNLDISDYENLLNELIYAQVHSYDDNQLEALGKHRSQSCFGDAANLQQELDNVYSSFIRDIKIADDKKSIIISSVKEQLEKTKNDSNVKWQSNIELLEKENKIQANSIEKEINKLRVEINNIEAEVSNLERNEIRSFEQKIEEGNRRIEDIETNNYRPKLPYYRFIPAFVFLILVVMYCVIFYSSAAYILIYSKRDAELNKLNGVMTVPPEIFNSTAIASALSNGFISFMFVILVPVFILGFIYVVNQQQNKSLRYLSLISFVLFVDGFTAYKVAESIYNIDYIRGVVDVQWEWTMAFKNSDFWLVLVFGLLALLTFEFLLDYIMKVMDSRNQDLRHLKAQELLRKENLNLVSYQDAINVLKSRVTLLKVESSNKTLSIANLEKENDNNELFLERKKNQLKQDLLSKHSFLENTTNLSLTKIENEQFKFSPIYFYDRISIFMRGWKDFLHGHFANRIAIEQSRQADEEVELWKSQNMKN